MTYTKYAIAGSGKKTKALKAYLSSTPGAILKPEIPIKEADDNTLIIRIKESKLGTWFRKLQRFVSCAKRELDELVVDIKETTDDLLDIVAHISAVLDGGSL